MKRNTLVNLLLGLGLVLALGVGVVSSSNQALAQDAVVQGEMSVQAAVGTAFTYQGRLTNLSGPVSGSCDFKFKLWTAPSGGEQAGVTVEKTGVSLNEGNFTVELDFGEGVWPGPDTFTGDARWLSVSVRCPSGSGSYTDLSGRVALNPAPYALSLRPGAVISGAPASGSVLTGEYTGSGASSALRGVNSSTSGTGVFGWATATSGTNYGVYGQATASSSGRGVYGEGGGIGVAGKSPASSGVAYGVYGESASPIGAGVYGVATATSGRNHGVYGKTSSPDGYGVYSEGNAHVEGNLTWKAKTSYVAVATSAFIPEGLNDTGHVKYDNEGFYLKNEDNDWQWFTAPVQLPHGATVTELRVGWRDGSNETAVLKLMRRSMSHVAQWPVLMAEVESVGSLGSIREVILSDDTINYALVDNYNYTYYLEARLPPQAEDIQLKGVVIVYEITKPY